MSKRVLVHGIDVVDVERFGLWLEDDRARVRDRFTPVELEHAADAHEKQHLAACFAAKEAVLKALGIGAGHEIRWSDIELLHDADGAPFLRLVGRAAQIRSKAGVEDLVVSISHAGGLAVASVVGWRGTPAADGSG